jgi:hypothetical protein
MEDESMKIKKGNIYGNLIVVARDYNERGELGWYCSCLCGNERIVGERELSMGLVQSCGCTKLTIKKDQFKKLRGNLIGAESGRLRVIEPSIFDGHWVAECTCGKKVTLTTDTIRYGRAMSCGCAKGNKTSIKPKGIKSTVVKSKSGYVGITKGWKDSWMAKIIIEGTPKYLGTFKDLKSAVMARIKAEEEYFGEAYTTWREVE